MLVLGGAAVIGNLEELLLCYGSDTPQLRSSLLSKHQRVHVYNYIYILNYPPQQKRVLTYLYSHHVPCINLYPYIFRNQSLKYKSTVYLNKILVLNVSRNETYPQKMPVFFVSWRSTIVFFHSFPGRPNTSSGFAFQVYIRDRFVVQFSSQQVLGCLELHSKMPVLPRIQNAELGSFEAPC